MCKRPPRPSAISLRRSWLAAISGNTRCASRSWLTEKKWFDTNYHYIVPELAADTDFHHCLSVSGVRDATQIHTHMCYSEFNDIMPDIAAMDADVITIETSRSDMELLEAFSEFAYPNEIGPGVYDIHSPNIPTVDSMVRMMRKASQDIPAQRLWVNPDCGLKTRQWAEVLPALANMVEAAKVLREAA